MFLCSLSLFELRHNLIPSAAEAQPEWHVRPARARTQGSEDRVTQSELEISCREVLREISNYLEKDAPEELRARLEAHFKGCNHCRAILDGTGNVLRLVGDGQAFDLPPGFSRRLQQRINKSLKKL